MVGIIFTGGECPASPAPPRENFIVIAADSGLLAAEQSGLPIDWIIGDMDSVDTALLDKYPPEKIIRFKKDKDYSDTELALQKAAELGCTECRLIGGGGGRMDHLLAITRLTGWDKWFTKTETCYKIDAQKNKLLELECVINTTISVFPLDQGPWKIKSKGLFWPIDNLDWKRQYSLSNRTTGNTLRFEALQGIFLIIINNT
ncbi:MAG: thiamine diphosphokinase [Spirochaetaceae bacterium]|jgi:thiamine pyrophosphokinase|nr:thiamine diphosphokinase [Spirochaetaceae bacterium]